MHGTYHTHMAHIGTALGAAMGPAEPGPGVGLGAPGQSHALWHHCQGCNPASTCCRAVDTVAARAAGGTVGARVGGAVVRHLGVRPARRAACWVVDGFGGVAHLLPVQALVEGSLVTLVEDLVQVRFTVGAEVGVTVGVGVQAEAGAGAGVGVG